MTGPCLPAEETPFVADEGRILKATFPIRLTPRGIDEALRLVARVYRDGRPRAHLIDLRNVNADYITPISRRLAVELATRFDEQHPGMLLAGACFSASPIVGAGHRAFRWFFPEDPPRRIFSTEHEAREWIEGVLRRAA